MADAGASQRDAPDAERQDVLYVANANRNTVSVIDLDAGKPIETIGTAIDPSGAGGLDAQLARAHARTRSVLFVANAATNDLAVVNVKVPRREQAARASFPGAGSRPRATLEGRQDPLYRQRQGGGSKANRDGPNPLVRGDEHDVAATSPAFSKGTLSRIPLPGPSEMARPTRRRSTSAARSDPGAPTDVRPRGIRSRRRWASASPITHCVYIIKENRTYDQVFGDMPEGNGERSLCLFPEIGDAEPPRAGQVSSFCSITSTSTARSAPTGTSGRWGRSRPTTSRRPGRSAVPGRPPSPVSRRRGHWRSPGRPAATSGTRCGEGGDVPELRRVHRERPFDPGRTRQRRKVAALQGHFDPKFRGYDLSYPDVKRAGRFLEEVAEFEKAGDMPKPDDPPPAQRPHLGHGPRALDADGDGRRQ